jgi:DNA invertase Pin-like site-specific DNA recombinase
MARVRHFTFSQTGWNMTNINNSAPVRCAIYTRSATGDVASLLKQEQNCRAAALNHGWTIRDGFVFTDVASSGCGSSSRPSLAALLQLAGERRQSLEYVIIDSFDRLGRDLRYVVGVLEFLESRGIVVYFASMQVDSRDQAFRDAVMVLTCVPFSGKPLSKPKSALTK